MSVVVGVKKAGRVAIASDTQSTQGNLILPGDIKASPNKIHRLGRAYFGIVGSMAHHRVIESLYQRDHQAFDFSSSQTIFESLLALQKSLVDDYYVRTDEDDHEQEYDSNQLFGIIASPSGLFSVQSYREVTEFEHFWAAGTGAKLAIGCMEAIYRSNRSAKAVAEAGVRVACRYDTDCGLPLQSHSLRLG